MWLNRFIAAAFLLFSFQAFGGTKEWKAHREAARAYAKDNDIENATASYRLALAEAENAFKKADIRYLDTVLEAGWHLTQRRDFDSAIQAYERALTRLTKAIGDEVLYKVALLLALGETHLFAAKAEDSQRRFDEAL